MVDMKMWMNNFQIALDRTFGQRVWFLGLQGSYGRGEATQTSDIDMVVILDELSLSDISAYDAMLNSLPNRELICGFLSGKRELFNWEPSDLFQFCHDTTPIRGSLEELFPLIDKEALNRAIRTGLCNLYHGIVHNMLYEKSEEILKALYKSASFIIQALHYRETGTYIAKQQDLSRLLPPEEKAITDTFIALKNGTPVCFQPMSDVLFNWCQTHLLKEK